MLFYCRNCISGTWIGQGATQLCSSDGFIELDTNTVLLFSFDRGSSFLCVLLYRNTYIYIYADSHWFYFSLSPKMRHLIQKWQALFLLSSTRILRQCKFVFIFGRDLNYLNCTYMLCPSFSKHKEKLGEKRMFSLTNLMSSDQLCIVTLLLIYPYRDLLAWYILNNLSRPLAIFQ